MTRIIPLLTAIFVAAASIGIDAPARADLITYTASTTPNPRSTDFSQDLSFKTFDKSLGTLNQVQISYTVTETISGSVTNRASINENFRVDEATNYTLMHGSTLLLNNALGATQSYVQLHPNTSANFGPFNPSGSPVPVTYTSGATFDAFQSSSGNVALTFDTLTSTSVTGGGGNISYDIMTQAGATVTVEYIYTAASVIPEPASIAMTMIGGFLVGSCWVVKRRVRSKPIG